MLLQEMMQSTTLPQELKDLMERLTGELSNFQDIAKYIKPPLGAVPNLDGIDIYGESIPLEGAVGGDHIIYLDFKKGFDLDARIKKATEEGRWEVVEKLRQCQKMAGIAVVDVSGHRITDALLAAMLHQAFLLGAIYEFDMFGQITKRLFENLNTRFYKSSAVHKFLTMVYGEISEDAKFRFLSAGHPPPLVFSYQENRFMEVRQELRTTFPPLGALPPEDLTGGGGTKSFLGFKSPYEVNEWHLMGTGDILLLCTDGLLEHSRRGEDYFPHQLERKIQEIKDQRASEIFEEIKQDFLAFNRPSDDMSIVIIKRN